MTRSAKKIVKSVVFALCLWLSLSLIGSCPLILSVHAAQQFIDEVGVPYEQWRSLKGANIRVNLARLGDNVLSARSTHFWKGLASASDRKYEEAISEFEQCGPLNNLSNFAVQQVAEAYIGAEEFDRAVPVVDALLKRAPNSDMPYKLRADAYFAKGKLNDAAALYVKSSTFSSPRRSLELARAGECLRNLKNYKEAIRVLTIAVNHKDDIQLPEVYLTRASCYQATSKWSDAVHDFTLALKYLKVRHANRIKDTQDAAVASALKERATCYAHMGKYNLATKDREAYKAIGQSVEDDFFGK